MKERASGPFDPLAIIRALDHHGVDYVIIGGTGAVLHGAPMVTNDLDVVPERGEDNLRRLIAALRELDARRVTEPDLLPSEPDVEDLRYRIELFDSPHGAIDVVMEATGIGGYERLHPAAVVMELEGRTIRVGALGDLIRAKQWSDRPKDRLHLRLLHLLAAEQHQNS